MAGKPVTLLQAAVLEAVRPTAAGRADTAVGLLAGPPGPAAASRARERHAVSHGPHPMEDCADLFCREAAAALAAVDPLAAHGCLHAAVIVYGDRRVWYPCRSHEDGFHRFAAVWPSCPAPWCRLLPGHHPETLHDIPPGAVELHHPLGAVGGGVEADALERATHG